MHVAYLDLKKVSDSFQPQLNETICRVTESGWYLLGKELEEFERKFASFCGSDHCIGVANGLDALTLILQGYIEKEGWQAGDEIIVPAHTFVATILAISRSGLKPVLCDVSLETALLDVDKIEPLITSRTRAILWVHLYGLLALPDRLQDLLQQYHLKLIEDAAQAHGAEWHGKRAGNWGDASAFSFYPGKNLGALGDGGAVVTSDTVLAHIVRQLRNYGSSEKYIHTRKGVNSRLDDMQAAILSLKLDRLQEDNTIRQTIADRYLRGIVHPEIVLPPSVSLGAHVYHIFPVRCRFRDALQRYLGKHGIATQIHYPIPPHKQKAYEEWGNSSYPIAEQWAREELSLPISPVHTADEIDYVIERLNNF